VSLRNRELATLIAAGLIVTLGFASVYLAQQSTISSASVSYIAIFLGLYLVAHIVTRFQLPYADPYLLPLATLMTGIGVTLIYRLDPDLALRQGVWVALGLILFVAGVLLINDYRRLESVKYTLGIAAVVLLLLPAIPGFGRTINGATLWVDLGPFVFQPGEFAKILIVLFLAGYLRDRRDVLRGTRWYHLPPLRHLGPLLIVWGATIVVLILTNDLGGGLLYFSVFLAMLYIATGRLLYVIGGLGLFAVGALAVYRITPHVADRVSIWLDPWSDPSGTGYQLVQSIYAISSGGLFGSGLGRGALFTPDGSTYIPFLETDFIYSALVQELGLAGGAALLMVFVLFVYRGFRVAMQADDGFSKLLVGGLTATFAIQAFLILGGVTGLIPLTGITLPFVSYGGSSVVANLLLLALILSVSDRANRRMLGVPDRGLVRFGEPTR
jgi:cell division protein FtsW (lipid II flippase)